MLYQIKGLAQWAKLTPEIVAKGKFTKDKYTLDLIVEDAKSLAFAKQLGLKINRDEQGKTYIKFQRYLHDIKGNLQDIKVVDIANTPMVNPIIGNGSLLTVEFQTKAWEFESRKGVKALMTAIQVENLVEFKQEPGSTFKGSAPSSNEDGVESYNSFETIGDEAVA